jgi:hypothetical protein
MARLGTATFQRLTPPPRSSEKTSGLVTKGSRKDQPLEWQFEVEMVGGAEGRQLRLEQPQAIRDLLHWVRDRRRLARAGSKAPSVPRCDAYGNGLAGRDRKCYTVSMSQVQATIAHHEYAFSASEIRRLLHNVMPEPLGDHFVVIDGKRFPPKQVISLATGLDRADFNSHQARRILSRLGFTVGRRTQEAGVPRPERPGPHRGREADALRPFAGRWVAQRGLEVLVAADTPEAVLEWLERHNQQADAMFHVPRDESQAIGIAPA